MATARECINKLISENIKGRKLVIVEQFVEIEQYLEENGHKCEFHVSLDDKKVRYGGIFRSFTEIKGESNKYYILVFKPIDDLLDALMKEYGFTRINDYCGFQQMHKKITDTLNYYDSFGNKCDFVPPNVTVTWGGGKCKYKN